MTGESSRKTLAGDALPDSAARAAQLSELVYLPPSEIREALAFHGYSYVTVLTGYKKTRALCARVGDDAYVSFRGTKTWGDLVVDLMAWPAYRPLRHRGFGRTWSGFSDGVRSWLDAHPAERVHLSGHSLGGAVANVAGLELAPDQPVASLTTFGAPRTFFAIGFGEASRPLEPISRRYVNGSDVIPRVVPAAIGYRHVGQGLRATDPRQPSITDKLMAALDGLTGQGDAFEPESKQMVRFVIGWALAVGLGSVLLLIALLMMGISTLTGGLRSGQSHARVRYVENLGLEALRPIPSNTEAWRALTQDPRSSRSMRTTKRNEIVATAILLVAASTVVFVTSGWLWAVFCAVLVAAALPMLQLLAWFSGTYDPVGDVGKKLDAFTRPDPALFEKSGLRSQADLPEIDMDELTRRLESSSGSLAQESLSVDPNSNPEPTTLPLGWPPSPLQTPLGHTFEWHLPPTQREVTDGGALADEPEEEPT